jgi:hypothetical protein
MTFTDDDLKRLKERPWCAHEKHAPRDCGVLASILESDLPALLARLEESEHFVTKAVDSYPHLKDSDVYQRWMKSCGL